jgi:hypothetical protein
MCLAALIFASGWVYASQADIEPKAASILKHSMTYLADLQKFEVITHNSIEAVLETGQKIQFDTSAGAMVQRPDKLYAARLGELVDQEFFYDGKTLTLHDIDSGFYATLEAPSTLEGMLDFARIYLDIVAPASDLVYADAYDILMDGVTSGFVVGSSWVDGGDCYHLAFSKPGTDFQIWVQKGDQPVPRKMVITSTDVMSAPQFTVHLTDWNLAPGFTEDKFKFVMPEDVVEIDFIMLEVE